MALFNFGKKKEEEKKTPACACSCGCAASEAESITNDCCPDLKEGEICCIKVLGAGCKSCHEQFEYTKQAVKDMGLSVEVEYITDMQKVMEYGVMSMPALVVNEKVVAMGKVLKAADVDRSEQSYSSPPGAVHLRGVPDSLVHRLCTGNAVYEIVKLHIGRMFFPQWVGTDTLHLLSVIQKFFYFFKSLCNSTSGTMPKTCYINLTITIHKK